MATQQRPHDGDPGGALPLGREQADLAEQLALGEPAQRTTPLGAGHRNLDLALHDHEQPVGRLALAHHDGARGVGLLPQLADQIAERRRWQRLERRHALEQSDGVAPGRIGKRFGVVRIDLRDESLAHSRSSAMPHPALAFG